jgi:uncharacterized protein
MLEENLIKHGIGYSKESMEQSFFNKRMKFYPSIIPNELFFYVESKMKLFNCPAHDIQHCIRVTSLALKLSSHEVDSDTNVVVYGAFLHDILDSKLNSDTNETETEVLNILKTTNLSANQLAKIMFIIKSVGFKNLIKEDFKGNEFSIEYKCVQDADLLDAIGAIGIARCFTYGGRKMRPLFPCEAIADGSRISNDEYQKGNEDNKNNSIQHFFDKLLHLKSMMMTDYGRVLAQRKHDIMITYLEDLQDELSFAQTPDLFAVDTSNISDLLSPFK